MVKLFEKKNKGKVEEKIVLEESPITDEESKEIESTETPEEVNPEVVETQEIKLDEVKEEVAVIDMNNKPVSLLAKGDFTAPRGFIPTAINKSKIGEYGCLNGRTYQVVGKDTAIWCDNGKQFALSKYADELR